MKKPEEIKKALKSCSSYECNGDHAECPYITSMTCVMDMANDALAYIDQIDQRLVSVDKTCPEWISVEENRPASVITACLICANGQIEIADWSHDKYGNDWWFYVQGEYETGVTHWMPLPEPPKEDDEV